MKTTPRDWLKLLCYLAFIFHWAPCASQAEAQTLPDPVLQNVAYGEVGNQKLLLDIYGANAALKRPAIIFMHGGGWSGGSKAHWGSAAATFARQGYVCFSVDYRLLEDGKNRYPAQIDDVQRAVRWVRAHADEYGADSQRIGAMGDSAGGHLVALLGTTETRDNSVGELASYSSRVQCVVDLYGPTDFTPFLKMSSQERAALEKSRGAQMVQEFLGPLPETANNYIEASPLTHIDKKTVPFLIFHGGEDDLVPLDQSQRLDAALRAAGIESKLVVFPKAGHGYSEPDLLAQTFAGAIEFFNRHLKTSKVVS